jgi:hypothetical protein
VPVQEVQQPGAPLTKHWPDLVHRPPRPSPVAEQELRVGRHRYAEAVQLVGVRSKLQQRFRLLVPRELLIAHPVGPELIIAYDEVRETVKPSVEEGRLIDDVRAAPERRERLLLPLRQDLWRVRLRSIDVLDATTGGGVVRSELRLQPLQLDRLVPVAELRDPLHQRVRRHLDVFGTLQLHVELAQQRELALRSSREV